MKPADTGRRLPGPPMIRWWALALALATASPASADCPRLEVDLVQVAPRIWLRPAREDALTGWTEPVVVWVSARRIWIADPGPHHCAGQALRQAILQRWPGRSHHLINTHAHARNVLANAAWPAGTPIHASAQTARQMARRCPDCLRSLGTELGPSVMEKTRIVVPNRLLVHGQTLRLGGQRWQVQLHEPAHTESDLTLWNPATGHWFAGPLLAWQGLPEVGRADTRHWLRALADAQAVGTSRQLLGTLTAAEARQKMSQTIRYLEWLEQHTTRAWEHGRLLHELLDEAPDAALWGGVGPQDAAAARRWRLQHQLNLQAAWRMLEARELVTPR